MPKNAPIAAQITVIIHDRVQATAAIKIAAELNLTLRLETPASMGEVLGPMWMQGLISALKEEGLPILAGDNMVFHCGASIGLAQAACAAGLPAVRLEPEAPLPPRMLDALTDIATDAGTTLIIGPPPFDSLLCPPPGGPPKAQTLENMLRTRMLSLSSDAKIT